MATGTRFWPAAPRPPRQTLTSSPAHRPGPLHGRPAARSRATRAAAAPRAPARSAVCGISSRSSPSSFPVRAMGAALRRGQHTTDETSKTSRWCRVAWDMQQALHEDRKHLPGAGTARGPQPCQQAQRLSRHMLVAARDGRKDARHRRCAGQAAAWPWACFAFMWRHHAHGAAVHGS